jgi:elongator complex protein 3
MKYNFDYTKHTKELVPLLLELEQIKKFTPKVFSKLMKAHPKNDKTLFSKDEVVIGYRNLAGSNGLSEISDSILDLIKKKPARTQSGVAPITVLTKPFPCPGKCIFCPSDVRMPKSYLSDEPGAQRAERNWFDPYLQTYNRLQALSNIGHSVSKAELIVLGGTWSFYPEAYQIWFIKECFRALNDFGTKNDDRKNVEERYAELEQKMLKRSTSVMSNDPKKNKVTMDGFKIEGKKIDKTYNQTVSTLYVAPEKLGGFNKYQSAKWNELFKQHEINETAAVRNVGLVIETRPDNISKLEVIRIRKLGCTKAQIGFQSLNDSVLTKNKRGHAVSASRDAVNLLRQAGFKIHAHWMANLYGSSVEEDKLDYDKLFNDPGFRPDELKIYPCSLIGSAELMQYYKKGLWKPYTYEELLEVLSHCLMNTPEYCRLTRVIRDIPSTDIIKGNKLTNFRQIAEQKLLKAGNKSKDIRSREIRNLKFDPKDLRLEKEIYSTPMSTEIFLQYVVDASKVIDVRTNRTPEHTQGTKILGFLRLSLPKTNNFIAELRNAAIIREIHVYGGVVDVGSKKSKKAQHLGLGTKLIDIAKKIVQEKEFKRLAVISAIGTREYYRGRGFKDGDLYQYMNF